jgi:cobalamin biosynthesis Mg chelatase CobN
MKDIQTDNKMSRLSRFCTAIGILIVSTMAGSCIENYGRLKHNTQVTQAFSNNQIEQNYRYFYYGRTDMPYAVVGIDRSYQMRSRVWREVDPDSEKFQKMIFWMWDDPRHYQQYFTKGADILDPKGQKVGVWYSSLRWAAIRFEKDKHIVIVPETPFLGGPER